MTLVEFLGIFWKGICFLWVSEVRKHSSLAFPDRRDRAVALLVQHSCDSADLGSCAWCLTDQGNQPLLHPDVCGGGWGAAPHYSPAVLLQAFQGHRSVPSGCQHHFWIKSQCSDMFAGDCHEILLVWGAQSPGYCLAAVGLWAFYLDFTVPYFAHL